MRRAVARGRMVPQSLSTDPRMGRLSLKAALLFPLIWINCDDQGRLSGDPDGIKYATCPNIDGIAKADIAALLAELQTQGFILLYTSSKTEALQMLDWWEVQKLQWAYPSEYPPPDGWQDRLRYHATPKEVITENWVLPSTLPNSLPNTSANSLPSTQQSDRESSKEITEEEGGRGRGRGRGNLPSALGSTSPSSAAFPQISEEFTRCYQEGWGKKTGGKILAQIRDFSEELAAAGCPASYVSEAFKEAAVSNKCTLSYVRAILLDWLGKGRGPPR